MVQVLINGLARGSVYALVALGYTMVYGILGMINFAHGEVFMLGMFGVVFALGLCTTLWGTSLALNLVVALVLAVLFAAGWGWANERIAYRKLRGANMLAPLSSAIGLSIVLQNFVMLAVTKGKVDFPHFYSDAFTKTHWTVLGARITLLQLTMLGTTAILCLGLWWLIQKTRIGISLRATSQDRLAASLMGIRVDRSIAGTFILGSALAAVAGAMVGMYQGVLAFDSGYSVGLKAFTAAVLGGIGNIPGAVLGGFLIGISEDLTSYWIGSDWKQTSTFVILILVLILRPRGLLGERVSDKV
jgi:branched-chain amino acid transport system permease protein